MNIVLHCSGQIIVDDHSDLVYVVEGSAQGIVDYQNSLDALLAILPIPTPKLADDAVTSARSHITVKRHSIDASADKLIANRFDGIDAGTVYNRLCEVGIAAQVGKRFELPFLSLSKQLATLVWTASGRRGTIAHSEIEEEMLDAAYVGCCRCV